MRWTLSLVLAFTSVASAQQLSPSQSPSQTPPPIGVDILARDGDRILIEDDARLQVVRRQQATIRTIYSQEERLLIVLVDYSKPGEFPDGQVDWAFNFYDVDGTWPLGLRWEALSVMFQYEGDRSLSRGFALETPQGLVQLAPGPPEGLIPDPRAVAVLSYRGSSNAPRRGVSFAEAETIQVADAARSKASNATVSTLTGLGGSRGTMVLSGGAVRPNDAPRPIRGDAPPPSIPVPQEINTSPPAGQEISANDGDRVIVDDGARIRIIRRRQAAIRALFNQQQRTLIVLADYAKPGQFPDGTVDMTFNFYEVEGVWPLAPRWEQLTTLFQYEGDPTQPSGYALATPTGLVQLMPGRPGMRTPEPGAIAVLLYRGASSGLQRRGWSFEDAEKNQLAEAAKRRQQR